MFTPDASLAGLAPHPDASGVSLDHDSECPFTSARGKDQLPQPYSTNGARFTAATQASAQPHCVKYNKYGGDCKFGASCKYHHVCSDCEEPHPRSKCPKQSASGPTKP